MSSRENISNQLESYSTPLKISSENPFEEFQIPKETLENRKIIGMGEATHSTKEFHQVRRRFFRFLVEELDYRIFAWEASFGETLEINNYVVNGEGTAEEALSSISSPIFRTEEILELVKWVRKHNKQVSDQKKVKFYGFDMQNDVASFKKLREKMQKVDNDFIEANNEALEFIEQGKMMFAEIDKEKESELKDFTTDLENQVKKKQDEYLETISEQEYGLLKQLVEILDQCRKYCLAMNEKADFDLDSWTFRGQCMAENISWIMDFEDEENAFVWAHNAHIKKGGKPENPESKALGYYLDQRYGEDYYSIGFDFGKGSFKYLNMEEPRTEWNGEKSFDKIHENTLAQELDQVEEPFFLDFTSIPNGGLKKWITQEHRLHTAGTYFHLENIEDHYDKLRLRENFDALIYIPEVSAINPV